nr:N-acetylmuramoyl-L-alanine amidase [uncultured Lachnoclostridium sp.]
MSNSSLVNYTKISPNKTSPRNHAIDTITIHCMAGDLSVETCGNVFAPTSRQASSNYGIGSDGRIGMYVEEKDRSWCSSSASNDNRAITIEVANDGGESTGWHVSDKAYNALINLVTDICKRNGIKKLLWKGDKSLIGQVDKQNMTVHRWFAAKSCPGDYLYNHHSDIANKVNAKLGATTEQPSVSGSYLVRVTADALNIRSGPGTSYSITGSIKDQGVYTIVQTSGNWGKLKSGAGWICLDYTTRV